MTETEFNQLTDATFHQIENALDRAEGEIDFELAAGNVLQIDCPDGKIIINRQTPMREIWLAARSGGFHYQWVDGKWRNTRDNSELLTSLARIVAEQGGGALHYTQD